jgi:two-component sensor histidine kinase
VGADFTTDRFDNENSAIFFQGYEGSYVNLGNYPALKPQVGSISLWAKIEHPVWTGSGVKYNPVIITKSAPGNDFYEAYAIYYMLESHRLVAVTSLDSTRSLGLFTRKIYERNKWHHLVLTYDKNSFSFFVDGKLEQKISKRFEITFNPQDSVVLGSTANKKNNRSLNGIVDDIEFYDTVLNESEVEALFLAPNPNKYKVVVNWLIIAIALFGFVACIYFFIKWRLQLGIRKEKQEMELQNRVLETELRVNRALMNPHFVFNSMNALQNFILRNQNVDANNYLVKFSKLLRRILESNMSDSISLEFEIELLGRYLEIEDLRFEENIKHSITVDPSVKPSVMMIPVMMIQPFVENAIWHGLLRKKGERILKISFTKHGDRYLQCIIEDNGVGRKKDEMERLKKRSLATGFVEQRLALLNKIHFLNCSLLIEDKPGSEGTIVKILMPILNN